MDSMQPNSELMRYLDNDMSEEERSAFAAKLQADTALRAEADGLTIARDAVRLYGTAKEVAQVHAEMRGSKTEAAPVIKMNSRSRILRFTAAAAAAVLLMFFAVNIYRSHTANTDTADNLYAAVYIPYDAPATRAAESTVSVLEADYRAGNYAAVISKFENGSAQSSKDMLMAGVSYLQTNRSPEAVVAFNALLAKNKANDNPAYTDEANYYLAMALLKTKSYQSAAVLMEKINADKNNPYSNKFPASFTERVKKLQIQ